MRKRILTLVLALALCVGLSMTAYAEPPSLFYINEISAYNEISISGGEATMYSDMAGSSDITKVVITHVLQKKSGSSYKDVAGTSCVGVFYDESMPSMEDIVECPESGTYRVKTTYRVTSPRGTDTHTKYSLTDEN